MSKQIAINFDEGLLEVNDCNNPKELLKNIKICRDCGNIRFLDSDITGLCEGHKSESLLDVLESKKKRIKDHLMMEKLRSIIINVVCLFILTMLNIAMTKSSRTLINQQGKVCSYIVKFSLVVTIILLFVQVYRYFIFWKRSMEGDSFYAMFMKEFITDSPKYQGQTWEDVIKKAYADEIVNLETWAATIKNSDQSIMDGWINIYTAAIELSNFVDCERLAVLRLFCLKNMGVNPQIFTDIERIMDIVSNETLSYWLDVVVKCLEHHCIPCSEKIAKNFLSLAEYTINHINILNHFTGEDIKKQILKGFIAIGPYYIVPSIDSNSKLYLILQQAISKNKLFSKYVELYNG